MGPEFGNKLGGGRVEVDGVDDPWPVLLVDDLTDTGWTLTMAARVVRQAGAPAVLPLTLAATS